MGPRGGQLPLPAGRSLSLSVGLAWLPPTGTASLSAVRERPALTEQSCGKAERRAGGRGSFCSGKVFTRGSVWAWGVWSRGGLQSRLQRSSRVGQSVEEGHVPCQPQCLMSAHQTVPVACPAFHPGPAVRPMGIVLRTRGEAAHAPSLEVPLLALLKSGGGGGGGGPGGDRKVLPIRNS